MKPVMIIFLPAVTVCLTSRQRRNGSSGRGARYYDSRIGRWGGTEPLMDKYPGATPYCYSLDNPVLFKDFNGLDLTVGGDKGMALNDLKSMFVDVDIQNRITADDNGVVSFNVKGLYVTSDAAITMLHFMVNVSENNYLYEYANQTSVTVREGSVLYEKGQSRTVDLNEDSYIFNGEINVSKIAFNVDGGLGNSGEMPKLNYDGQVTLGSGNWITNSGKGNIEGRQNIVFHALAENYFRTELGMPHHRGDKTGAHQEAVNAANRNFKNNTSIDPGHNVQYNP